MGLLIQTSVLIMVIALITYARLDQFIPKKALETEIVNYMSSVERGWINRTSVKYYDDLHPTKKASGNGESDAASRGIGYISLMPLFEEDQEKLNNTRTLLRNLFNILYGNQPFVTNLIRKGAYSDSTSLFNELIDAIIIAGKNRLPDDKLKTADQFMQLSVGSLQSIFVNAINGCSCFAEEPVVQAASEEDEGEGEDAQDAIPRNYCSLFSFATMVKGKTLSIYLAPEEILLALYGNPQIVAEIIQTRSLAYKEYSKNPTPEGKAALERFKNVQAAVDSKYLDFSVTKTDPNRKRKKHPL